MTPFFVIMMIALHCIVFDNPFGGCEPCSDIFGYVRMLDLVTGNVR